LNQVKIEFVEFLFLVGKQISHFLRAFIRSKAHHLFPMTLWPTNESFIQTEEQLQGIADGQKG
jgi:hypothetical protein